MSPVSKYRIWNSEGGWFLQVGASQGGGGLGCVSGQDTQGLRELRDGKMPLATNLEIKGLMLQEDRQALQRHTHSKVPCEKYTKTYCQTHSHELFLNRERYVLSQTEIHCQGGMLPELCPRMTPEMQLQKGTPDRFTYTYTAM